MSETRTNSSLPKIRNRRIATEGQYLTNRLSLPSSSKNSMNLKTEVKGNEYRKAMLQYAKQYEKVKHIFTKNQRIEPTDEKERLLLKLNRSMAAPEI